jgi:hypothetical protein
VENAHRLYTIFDGFRALSDRARAVPAMFNLMERYPDAELGSPGPLVHEIEAIGNYETELQKSLARQPTYLTVWMVNRILNSDLRESERIRWLSALRAAADHPATPQWVKDEALDFLGYQER